MYEVNLTQLKSGQSAIVTQIQGGVSVITRLERMGIREGKKISKVSSQIWQGPQTIKVGHAQFAIGFGIAKKILVRVQQ